jgi:hypothetical protein
MRISRGDRLLLQPRLLRIIEEEVLGKALRKIPYTILPDEPTPACKGLYALAIVQKPSMFVRL